MTEEERSRGDEPRAPEEKKALDEQLVRARERISAADAELVRVIGERRALAIEIGRIKEALGLPVLDPAREAEVVRRAANLAREQGVDEEMTRDVIWRIIASARNAQEGKSRG